uniref:Uncharacterized protein n=2 Tax=Oryza brachyantha TaxID=4533 RepID=J3MSS6_ORYBR
MWRGGAATWPAVTLDRLPFKIVALRRCSLCDKEEVGGRRSRRHCQQWCYYYDAGEGVYLHVACVKRIARRRWQAGMESGCGGRIMLASEELMNVGGALNSIASSSSEARKVIGAAVRVIIAVIFGDQTAVEGDVSSSVALNLQWLTCLFGIQT